MSLKRPLRSDDDMLSRLILVNKRIKTHVDHLSKYDYSLEDKLQEQLEQLTGLDFMHLLARKRPQSREEVIELYEKYFTDEDTGEIPSKDFIETFMSEDS